MYLKFRQKRVVLTCSKEVYLPFTSLSLDRNSVLLLSVMRSFKAVAENEEHCNRLEVYPSGANPLNDILIAFLYLL